MGDPMTGMEAFMPLTGIPYRVSNLVPLTRIDRDTGEAVDALCWRIWGELVFHPLRLAQLKQAIARQGIELARWDDDGGRGP